MRNLSGVYGAKLALALIFSCFLQPSRAQTPFLWLANGTTTNGAWQNILNLGNLYNSTANASFNISTSDNGTSYLDIHATRWGNSVGFSRADPSGNSYTLMTVYGTNTVGTTLTLNNSSNTSKLQLNTTGLSYFNGGAVCINCTNPGSNLLAVEGNFAANKVTVSLANPFPDYVFGPDYRLPSLDSLSRYVAANRHLPDLPSATTVAKDGLDLGENQAILVRKIEELTLYLIGQNNEMQRLKKENNVLQARNLALEELERRISRLEDQARH
jgi:hypothetical protein